jgi:hypothetical protein
MFQFENLANLRFDMGECSEKTERRGKRRKGKKVNAKKGKNETFISSIPSLGCPSSPRPPSSYVPVFLQVLF